MGLITWINEFREFPRYSDFLLNLQGHIVILGFNEVGVELAEFYRARKTDVLCIDLLCIRLDPLWTCRTSAGDARSHEL